MIILYLKGGVCFIEWIAILTHTMMQVVFSIGVIIIFSEVFSIYHTLFIRLLGTVGVKVMHYTSKIGTPIHELGHVIMCLIFGHKIIEIKWYQFVEEGHYGYVNHTFNKRNLYQRVGHFFIGLGPIIFGTLIIMLLLYVIYNSMFELYLDTTIKMIHSNYEYKTSLVYIKNALELIPIILLKPFQFHWWIWIILSIPIVLHMNLSQLDLKDSAIDLRVVLLIWFLLNGGIYLWSSKTLYTSTTWIITGSLFMISFLLIPLLIMMGLTLLSFIYYLSFLTIKKFTDFMR